MENGYRVWMFDPNAIEVDEHHVTITKHRVSFPPGIEPSDQLLQASRHARAIAADLSWELGLEDEVQEAIGRPIRLARPTP